MSMGMNQLNRRSFLYTAGLAVTAGLTGTGYAAGTETRRTVDVCVYGGTSGGVIAAVALSRLGRSVLLIEPSRHLGGMTSGGLGWIDYGKASTIGGVTKRYFDEVRAYYRSAGVPDSGWSVEPHVAEQIFERWLLEQKVEVLRETRLGKVRVSGRRIRSLSLDSAAPDESGAPALRPREKNYLTVQAAMFIDASYEGDLLAAAGVSSRTDREGRQEYGESLAGICLGMPRTEKYERGNGAKTLRKTLLRLDPYVRPGDSASGLLPLVSARGAKSPGQADSRLQACTFRLCLTRQEPLPITPPADYEPRRFELVRRLITALEKAGEPLEPADLYFNFGHPSVRPHPRLLKITRLVRGKTDVNSGSAGVSMDLADGGAERYAEAGWPERARIWRAHRDYQRGLWHFLATDPELPDWLRGELSGWGLPRDEFKDTGGWPFQLYIREARRMVGSRVVTQGHCEHPAKGDDAVAFGSYALDSHICQRLVVDHCVAQEGWFYSPLPRAYPIPYGAIVPKESECENLLATFCVSSSHVAFASVRMEPVFMMLSESAAVAADQALRENSRVQGINLARLRALLLAAGQVV
jgi:hypothetical protein